MKSVHNHATCTSQCSDCLPKAPVLCEVSHMSCRVIYIAPLVIYCIRKKNAHDMHCNQSSLLLGYNNNKNCNKKSQHAQEEEVTKQNIIRQNIYKIAKINISIKYRKMTAMKKYSNNKTCNHKIKITNTNN